MADFIIEQEDKELESLNEIFIKSLDTLPVDVENSILYPKIRNLLHPEINRFTREHRELKDDLNIFRMNVGEQLHEGEIREYLDGLKQKYNMERHNVGLEYHIEVTRYDYGVPVFVIIKRDIIYVKKFVFRFRKPKVSSSLGSLSPGGLPIKESKEEKVQKYKRILGGDK